MTAPAAALYVGQTTHARMTPFVHRFTYRIASLWIDVDRLADAERQSALFSIDRFNLFAFHRRDHGERCDIPLRPWAEARFAEAGVTLDGGPVRLLTLPRVLGFVFNPVSVWFGYGPSEDLRGIIYEVNNTFGDTHAYVAPARDAEDARHDADKLLYVSPFFDARGRYDFRVRAPDDRFRLVIRYSVDGEDALIATQVQERRALTNLAVVRAFVSQPLLTLMVVASIHWEALKLWRRGASYRSRPAAPPPASVARPADERLDRVRP